MKPNTALLHTVWNDSKEFISKKAIELDQIELDEVISSVFSNGPFYFYILDFVTMEIKYISPSVKDIHGLDPDKVTFQDILDQIHPEDMDFVAKAEKVNWDLVYNKLEKDKIQKYKTSYCFRFRTSDGSYQLFNHQALALTTDENGATAKALNIHTNISHLTSVNNFTISLIGMFGEPSYLNIPVVENNNIPLPSNSLFSKREIQIIHLISDGFTNDQIGNNLNIAVNTVKNHRKNILRKANCKNMGQLITKCITEGLI